MQQLCQEVNLLGRAHRAFDANGDLVDERTVDFLDSCFYRFLRFVSVANQLKSS